MFTGIVKQRENKTPV